MNSEVEGALGLRVDVIDDQLALVSVMAHQIDGLLAEQVVDVARCLDLAKERHLSETLKMLAAAATLKAAATEPKLDCDSLGLTAEGGSKTRTLQSKRRLLYMIA